MSNLHGIYNFIDENRASSVKVFLEDQEKPLFIEPTDSIDWQYQTFIYVEKSNGGYYERIFINAEKIIKVECMGQN